MKEYGTKEVYLDPDRELLPPLYVLGAISIGLLSRAVERQFVAGAEWLAHASADDIRKYIRFLRQKLEEDPQNPELT